MVTVKLHAKTHYHMIAKIVSHVKHLPLLIFSKNLSAYLAQRISTDTANLLNFFLYTAFSALINAVSTVIIIFTVFKINSFMSFGICLLIPLYFFVHSALKKPLRISTRSLKESSDNFFSALNNQISYIKEIKIQSIFQETDKYLQGKYLPVYDLAVKTNRIKQSYKLTELLAKYFISIAVFVYSSNQILTGNMTVGEFTVLNTYVGMLISGISGFLTLGSSYEDAKVSLNRVMELMGSETETDGDINIGKVNSIVLNNLTFRYNDSADFLFNNINFTFEAGKIYALTGCNGSGKSTLFLLLLGLLKNYSGQILYNGLNISDINMYLARKKKIAVVTQNPEFFYETVSDNLDSADIPYNLIQRYASICNLDSWFEDLGKNINTRSFTSVSNLSGGEKQRFSIFQALVKGVDVMLLDEPSSALDNNSVEKLAHILQQEKKDKIIIIITHDNALINLSDEQVQI